MNESLEQFRGGCREAFAYLLQEYGFSEVESTGAPVNPYHVKFGNGEIELCVQGEGYGATAYICYLNKDGLEVPSRFLEPGWEPKSIWKSKRKKGPRLSQMQQIFHEAGRIRERDSDILGGDYRRLDNIALRWQEVRDKMYGRA